ncbi:AAA family ATPase [Phormidium sp. LEGE 05292]|uniref:trifunctional serine/threonine-protein kinase/ATP-binding protein/sensor histidine kinase n=1 Tax=[Phormidium] sp. LEGE 05292 TaxID=767427 RepID=UPI00188065E0|nr:ATP-binding sensor histidine kinase [Phormidium sp. LEGE 05292]MBE9225671.1 AAA family ATPase [Phormidium sp. LEGE 05292]
MELTNISTKIPGYRITEPLYVGSKTLVYRAIRELDEQPVVIKQLRQEYPTFKELLLFRNQYAIAKNLDLPGVIRCYSLENYRNSYLLIMEDFGGISLKEYISHRMLDLAEFLPIALQIVTALDGLYSERIIHKDIKPANILINPNTKQVKLIDFSIASLLPRETQEIKGTNVFEGTLAYISPEQTGRMNRGIDYRTDFYSLGVSFYELLTGRLPFPTHDPMELLHSHLTKQPIAVQTLNPTIPLVVSNIIDKLMAKNAEDRYQSALGIKHDLENCLNQWQETGKIELFELGKRDICDRFVISEKLYGRQEEVNTLLAAFENRVSQGNSELILVAGFSGIGKTAVVNEIHKPIVRQKGYFIKGKFDQFQRNIPFSAFVQAFRDLMEQLLSESDERLQQWQKKILAALGENGQVIIEVIPELEQIIGQQPAVPELSGEAAQNRFNLLFKKFIQVFATQNNPLTIFIDDLQWTDSASLKLIQLLMSESDTGYLLLIGAYRDNEVNPTHPLILTLEKLQKLGVTVNTITLSPLTLLDLNQLIADTLNCPLDLVLPLTELVYQKTQGNPFFSNQFIKYLYEEQVISFNFELGYWQCNIAEVRALAPTDDIVEFMGQQLQKLPQNTQNALKLAACIGNEFDLHTLAIVAQKTSAEIATDLWIALQEGLIVPKNEVYKFFQQHELEKVNSALSINSNKAATYKFLHDRVQQAAYFLIPQAQKNSTHQQIGKLLLQNIPLAEREDNIFEIVNHLNIGANEITIESEKAELIQLNRVAGHKAKLATAYELTAKYLNMALDLLSEDCWETEYDRAINVYLEAIEAEYLTANFEKAESLAEIAHKFAKEELDKVKIYAKQLLLLITQNRLAEVLKTATNALQILGVDLPENPDAPSTLVSKLQEDMISQGIQQIEDLSRLDLMTDPTKLEAMRILMILFAPVLIGYPHLMPLLGFKMVDLCVKYGNSPLATFAYVFYGWLLCGVLGDIEAGYKFGQLGVNLLSQFSISEINCRTEEVFYGFVKHWKDHLSTTLDPLLKSFQAGIDVGDLEYAGYSATIYCHNLFFLGQPLDSVTQEQEKYINVMRKNKQEFLIRHTSIIRQLGLQFQGKSEAKYQLIGESFHEVRMMPELIEKKTVMSIFSVYSCKAMLCYFLKDFQQALANARSANEYVIAVGGMNVFAEHYFYYSLTLLACANTAAEDTLSVYLEQVKNNQEKMQVWANSAPMNYQHKYALIEAEKLRILGKNWQAAELYDQAILGAKQQNYLQEEALANELAAEFYFSQGRDKLAQVYLVDAYYAYERWGAKIKIQDLEQRYPQLISSILESEKLYLQSVQTTINNNSFVQDTNTQTLITQESSSTSESLDLLDLAAVVKASQALSGEIQLDRLLAKLMQVVMENAGADQGILILNREGSLEIVARCFGSRDFYQLSVPVESSFEIPLPVINFVKRTQETLLINDPLSHTSFATDAYFMDHQPKSFLCTPILNQGKLIGILYLENNLTCGAFTSDRLEVLQLLSSQAAISLENAILYSTLEQKVAERTQELSQALEDLKTTQKRLVESEKMAALGSLVAGVAHEINTPVGTSITVASTLADATQSFMNAVEQGQLKRSTLNNYLEVASESTDLILHNLQRAGELIQSFKQVAVDQTNLEKRTFGVISYLEEVLLSLAPQFKQADHVLTIEGDETIAIDSYPGALAQIVTNLVVNSLTHAYQPGECGNLRLEISQLNQEVIVQYSDDGCGIPEENLDKIFNPFFTTARNQGGSGLGLHIVHNLVTQKLQGTIDVSSKPGLGTLFIMKFPL